MEFLYRYECRLSRVWDEMYYVPLRYDLVCSEFKIIKRTPKGVWISMGGDVKKFVNLTCRKKFACLTKEDALDSFIIRKQRYIGILHSNLTHAQEALKLATREKDKLEGAK